MSLPGQPSFPAEPPAMFRFALAVSSLAWRELVRFFRQRTRLVGALGQPLMFWILFGAGLRGSFRPPDWAGPQMSYQEYFFTGVIAMILLFTAIFATISIIEDRRDGFLQGVLAAPVGRLPIVLGKVVGGALIAVLQALLFLALAPTVGLALSLAAVIKTTAFMAVVALALTALGFLMAWKLDSTQGYHAMMSVVLFPMWLLSGAFFPVAERGWLSWLMWCNPLTYAVAGLRRMIYGARLPDSAPGLPSQATCLGVTCLFLLVCLAGSVWLARRPVSADAR